jgi:hypothetical protein
MMVTCMNGSPLDVNVVQLQCCYAHSFIGDGSIPLGQTRYGLGIPFPDTTYAFRAFDVRFVRKLGLKSGGFEISPEITFKVVLAGGRVGEVSGRQTRRMRGKSRFRFFRAFSGYSRVVREAFYLRLRGTRNRVV